MRRYGPWLAAALVVLSNLAAWRVAALNRSGEPEAVLVLTERELRLPARQAENTALTLALVFEPPRQAREAVRAPGWFDRATLESVGFDCSRPLTAENADYYRTRPPRTTYAALDSHLLPIDVDNNPAALRGRYPDTRAVAVMEATVALRYVSHAGQRPFLMGRVTSVLPREIHVPREWRSALVTLQADEQPGVWPPPQREPRFRATVAWGERLEPWITHVELLTPEPGR
jgi:hypothetical protein